MYHSFQELNSWYESSVGRAAIALESKELTKYLPKVRGNFLLCLGGEAPKTWLSHNPILHKANIGPSNKFAASLDAKFSELPFEQNSIDGIVLQHTLETTPLNPKAVFNEAWRVLAPSGYLIILGFNPYGSLRLLNSFTQVRLPLFQPVSLATLKRWLYQKGAKIQLGKSFGYGLALRAEKSFENEKVLQLLFPNAGDIYFIIARKQIIPLTRVKEKWSWEKLFNSKDYAQPSTGRIPHG